MLFKLEKKKLKKPKKRWMEEIYRIQTVRGLKNDQGDRTTQGKNEVKKKCKEKCLFNNNSD